MNTAINEQSEINLFEWPSKDWYYDVDSIGFINPQMNNFILEDWTLLQLKWKDQVNETINRGNDKVKLLIFRVASKVHELLIRAWY